MILFYCVFLLSSFIHISNGALFTSTHKLRKVPATAKELLDVADRYAKAESEDMTNIEQMKK